MPCPCHFTPGKRPSTHRKGGWVGPRAGLDRGRKYRPPQPDMMSRLSQVAISTTLSQPILAIQAYVKFSYMSHVFPRYETYMKHLSSKLPRALILSPLAEQPVPSTKYLSWAAVYGRNIYLLIMITITSHFT